VSGSEFGTEELTCKTWWVMNKKARCESVGENADHVSASWPSDAYEGCLPRSLPTQPLMNAG